MRKLYSVVVAAGLAIAIGVCPAQALTGNEVKSKHIAEADNTSGQNTNLGKGVKTGHIQNNAVTSAKIAADAVTSSQIQSGAVTAGKLALGAVTAPSVAFYQRVVIVDANGGGDFTSPVAALASITTASAANPHLVKIMPGVYDVGATPVQMKEFVDIEGSGETATVIVGAVDGGTKHVPSEAVVLGADNAQLRFLTVQNTFSAGVVCAAVSCVNGSPSLLHVRALATGTGDLTRNIGVGVEGQSPSLEDVTVWAGGGKANYGVVSILGSETNMRNILVEVDGGLYANGVGNYSGANVHLQGAKIVVNASPVSGSESVGILSNNSSPLIKNVVVLVGGGDVLSYGIENAAGAPRVLDSLVEARGNGNSFGIYAREDSAPSLSNVHAYGMSAGLAVVEPTSPTTILIDRSTIRSDSDAIINANGNTLLIGASQLKGGLNILVGTWVCAGAYEGAYVMLDATCNTP